MVVQPDPRLPQYPQERLFGAEFRMVVAADVGHPARPLAQPPRLAHLGWEQRIGTGQLNTWLNALIAATPPPMRGGKQPRVLFATQAGIKPPHFVLFTTGFLEETYRRFIERKLREEFGFAGTPIKVSMRLREKRGKNAGKPPARRS